MFYEYYYQTKIKNAIENENILWHSITVYVKHYVLGSLDVFMVYMYMCKIGVGGWVGGGGGSVMRKHGKTIFWI